MKVTEIWERIEHYLAKNFPQHLACLNLGAMEEEIVYAETVMKIRLPEDFRESLKRHNGQNPKSAMSIFGFGELVPLEDIVRTWRFLENLHEDQNWRESIATAHPSVKANWWNLCWVPITSDGCGNHECLDLNPTSEGHLGQVITMWHDDSSRSLCAASFADWLEDCAQEIERGDRDDYLL